MKKLKTNVVVSDKEIQDAIKMLEDSSLKQTIAAGVKKYFLDGLSSQLDQGWRPIRRDEIDHLVSKAVDHASEETDNTNIEFVIDDHCLHWLVDLTITYKDGEKHTFEVPINRCDPNELHPLAVRDWIHACLHRIIDEQGTPYIDIARVQAVCDEFEDMMESCKGCHQNVRLLDVTWDNKYPVFRVGLRFIFENKKIFQMGVNVKWPRS